MNDGEIEKVKQYLSVLESRKKTLIEYTITKVDEGDWHGASDACNDLREIEANLIAEKKLLSILQRI